MRRVTGLPALLGLVVVLLAALAVPASANLTGAVWTTTANGAKVNANLYDQKCPPSPDPCVVPPLVPYLSGGPNFASPTRWVPDGEYFFQVTDPAGKVLLSTDNIECRRFLVGTDGNGKKFIAYPLPGNPAPHIYCHDAISDLITIALCPFLDTPNNGGVYKLWITNVDDYNPSDPGSRFGFIHSLCKTDNFKVKKLASVWGKKVDDQGDPVEGVHIILYSVVKVKGVTTLVRIDDTITDGNGEFSFTNLSTGNYAVDEDLGLSLPPIPPGAINYVALGWTRVSPAGPIYFNITKGDTGGKNGPGAPKYVGQFVNEPPVIPFVTTLSGSKFLDVNGDGKLLDQDENPQPGEVPLAGWVITLEEKTGNGTWQQARYSDEITLVEPEITGAAGTYSFTVPAGKVYRICEYKWVDLDNDTVLDYTYDAVLFAFGGECAKADAEGWLQTAPGTGNAGPWAENPPDADIAVDPDTYPGQFVVEIGTGPASDAQVSLLLFGNKLGEICAYKVQTDGSGNPIGPVEGYEFCLYESDGVTPVTEDGLGNAIECQPTEADGTVCWDNLLGGDYCVGEAAPPGWQLDPGPEVQCDSLDNGGSLSFTFQNYAVVGGLTPGYWRNWRNHYTSEQICDLLQGTIADVGDCAADIAAADAIFDHWDANPDDYMTILNAFLLCDQLTINLTQSPGYPNPSNGSLIPDSMVYFNGQWIKLSDVLDAALAIWANPYVYERDYVILVKDALGAFMTR